MERHWHVLIWPAQYDDPSDTGYAWSGIAENDGHAVVLACAECESTNGWDAGDVDPETVKVLDCHIDLAAPARLLLAEVEAYDAALSGHAISRVAGYADLLALVRKHLNVSA